MTSAASCRYLHNKYHTCTCSLSHHILQRDRRLFSFPDCHSGTMSHHASVPPSITSSHRTQSCLSCPSMHCPGSPHVPADMRSQTGRTGLRVNPPGCREVPSQGNTFLATLLHLHPSTSDAHLARTSFFFLLLCFILLLLPAPATAPFPTPPSFPSSTARRVPLPFHSHPATLRTRYPGSRGEGFSLAEVQQELQMLQRQLADNESASA